MNGFKRILLLLCQVALVIFAGAIVSRYLTAVSPPVYRAWVGALSISNPFRLILGPAIAAYITLTSYAIGRLLWTRLGGKVEFPSPGTEFILLTATGLAVEAIAAWVLFAAGVNPSGLIFFASIVALAIELTPTLETLRGLYRMKPLENETASASILKWVLLPMIICISLTPFISGSSIPPDYLSNPLASFKHTLGYSPLGLDASLFLTFSKLTGPWSAPALNIACIWLILIAMVEIAWRIFNSMSAGLLGCILFLCIPFLYLNTAQPSGELVMSFFLMAAFSALIWFLFENELWALPLSGFLTGLALSVSSKGIIFAALFLTYALIKSYSFIRRKPVAGLAALLSFALFTAGTGALLLSQNRYLAESALYPVIPATNTEFQYPTPPEPKRMPYKQVIKPVEIPPVTSDTIDGVNFQDMYGSFMGVGYKLTMSTDGDLAEGPQGLGPLFMAFIPGILLLMITRRHTLQAWTLILILLFAYLFWAYVVGSVSLRMLFAIFPFQAMLTGYIIDRLYLLSKLDERRPMSYIFLALFIPTAIFVFLWTCPGFGLA